MRSTLLTIGFLTLAWLGSPTLTPCAPVFQEKEDAKAELKKRLETVDENDGEALYQLALWAESQGLRTDSKRVMRKVIKANPDHEAARKDLGYIKYKDEWLTERQFEQAKAKELEAEMEAKGLKKFGDQWVPKEDWEKLNQGLVPLEQDGKTLWVTPQQKMRIEQGMVLLEDGSWLTKEEVEMRAQGKHKCGNEWKTLEEADVYHSSAQTPWEFEKDLIALRTTCRYEFAQEVLRQANRSVQLSFELLGAKAPDPKDAAKIELHLYKDINDYNALGNIPQDAHDADMSTNYAAFTFVNDTTSRVAGVANYSVPIGGEGNIEASDNYTLMMVRHAAAEAAVRNMTWAQPPRRWLTMGIGCYAGRYWHPFYSEGTKRLGAYSVEALKRKGLEPKFDKFFEPFQVSEASVIQSGLILSYLIHGQGETHGKLKALWDSAGAKLKSKDQKDLDKDLDKMQQLLASKDCERELAAFVHNFLMSAN